VNLKSVLGWLALAFVVWWIIEQPSGAAHVVHNVGSFLRSAAAGLSNFFACIGSCPAPGKHSSGGGLDGADWFGIIAGGIIIVLLIVALIMHLMDRKKDKN